MTSKPTLTVERLRDVLNYDPLTGIFRWRRAGSRHTAGKVAGHVDAVDGYRRIYVDVRLYKAHRLAWFYVYGRWPEGQIDHINRVKDDNRVNNLREANHSQNRQNSGDEATRRSSSGLLGAYRNRDRWVSQISGIYLGMFDTPEEAHAAYIAAKRELHPFWVEHA